MSDRHDADLAVASIRMAAAIRGGTVRGSSSNQPSEGTSILLRPLSSATLFGAACRSLGIA